MAQITWVGTSSGSWGTPGNWSGDALPGASDTVTIGVPGVTVSVGTGVTAVCATLTVENGSALAISGGSLTTDSLITMSTSTLISSGTLYTIGSATYGGSFDQTGGTYMVGGSGAVFNAAMVQSGGTIDVLLGQLVLNDGGELSAAMTGAGTLNVNAGDAYVNTGFSCKLNNIVVGGNAGKLGFNINYIYTGNFTLEQQGVLDLFGHVLTLSGASVLSGTTGYGTVVDNGTMTLGDGATQTVLDDGLVLSVKKALTQSGNVNFGASDSGAKVLIQKTGTYDINGNWTIGNPSSIGSITDAGTFAKTGGGKTAEVNVSFTNTGTVNVAIGELLLNGLVNTINGTVSGAGTLGLSGGQTTFGANAALKVASVDEQGGVLVVNKSLSYGGEWDQTGGVLDLNTSKVRLILSGQTDFSGGTLSGYGGTIVLSGGAQIGDVTIGGPDTIMVEQALHQTNTVTLGLASNTTVDIAAGASWLMEGNGANQDNSIFGYYGLINNAGTFGLQNGSSEAYVQSSVISTGTVIANNGTLSLVGLENALGGTVAGNGQLSLGGTTTLLSGLTLSVAAINFGQAGADTLYLAANESYANVFTQLTGTIDMEGGNTLSLTGATSLDYGFLTDGGVLSSAGPTVLNQYSINQGSELLLSGATEQTGFQVNDNGDITIASGGVYTLDDDLSIYGSGTIDIAGELVASGTGTSSIAPTAVLSGTLAVNDQLLSFTSGATLGGQVTGSGTLELSGSGTLGQYYLAAGLSLGVQNLQLNSGATLLDQANLTYAGSFVQQANSLISLQGHTLSMSGTATLNSGTVTGPGTLDISGSGTVIGENVYGGSVLEIAGTSSQIGALQVGEGSNGQTPPATAELLIAAGATYYLEKGASISGNGTLDVAGTLSASANTALSLGPTIVDTGTIAANLGTVSVLAAISGAGSFVIGTQGLLDFGAVSTIGTATGVSFTAGGGQLLIQSLTSFNATLENFASQDVIAFTNMSGSLSVAFGATHDQLLVSDKFGDSITLQFNAAQTLNSITSTVTSLGYAAIVHS